MLSFSVRISLISFVVLIPPPFSMLYCVDNGGVFISIMKKISFYIDGQNTYYALKKMGMKQTTKYNYQKLIEFLVSSTPSYVGYYVGQIKRYTDIAESEDLYQGQQKHFSHIMQTVENINLIKGKIMRVNGQDAKCTEQSCPKKNQPVFYEKGVDVRMAIDIVHHALRSDYDEAYLLSSDTDLIPAVQRAQEVGKIIHYIGFQEHKSTGLMVASDTVRVLTKEECENFEFAEKEVPLDCVACGIESTFTLEQAQSGDPIICSKCNVKE